MSYEPTDLERSIQTWLAELVDVTVIYEHQDAPRPATPFVSWFLVDNDTIGEPSRFLTDEPSGDDFVECAEQSIEQTVRVTIYGARAHELYNTIKGKWGLHSVRRRAGELGFVPYRLSQGQRRPVPMSQRTEDRWVFNINMYTTITATGVEQAVASIEVDVKEAT